MKILVMSDSHGRVANMLSAASLEEPDVILHLGDNDKDCVDLISLYPDTMLRVVRGNSDFFSAGLDMDEFVLEGKRFFMTHGHLFGVKTGRARIIDAALHRNADVLLFGHTHIPYYSVSSSNLIMINPGSIGAGTENYAVLEIKNGAVNVELKTL